MALYSVGPSRLKGECAKRSALEHKHAGPLPWGVYHGLASLCLVLSWAWVGHFIFISAAAGQGRRGSRRCVIPSNIMLDGGRVPTGEDMPCEMVVAEFFFSVLAHRLGVACLALVLVLHTYLQGLCSARKFLCCLLAGARFFAQLHFRRPGRSVDSLDQPWRPLENGVRSSN